MGNADSHYLNAQHFPAYLNVDQSRLSSLTPRELTILRMVAAGLDNRAAARVLGISEATVKRHLTAVLAKLGVESRLKAGLIGLAASLAGWLEWHESVIDEGRIDHDGMAARD
jgi:DNA-binding NarL/FixJ family response regulator